MTSDSHTRGSGAQRSVTGDARADADYNVSYAKSQIEILYPDSFHQSFNPEGGESLDSPGAVLPWSRLTEQRENKP